MPNRMSLAAWRALCQKRIAETNFKPSDSLRFEQLIVHSVEHNLANGRFRRVATNRPHHQRLTTQTSVDRVIVIAQDEFARLITLEEQDDAQTARRLHKTKQSVYNLRVRALARLNEILTHLPRKK